MAVRDQAGGQFEPQSVPHGQIRALQWTGSQSQHGVRVGQLKIHADLYVKLAELS